MTSKLRAVLNAFEDTSYSLSINELAMRLDVTPGMLEGMIAHWIRKGKIRETSNASQCTACGGADGCPFMLHMPRTYELVTDDMVELSPVRPGCGCGGCF